MDDLIGKEIRGFKLISRVGSGGMGEVYRAVQPSVGREVAIKVIRPEYADRPEFINRFEAEAHMIAKLEHPHIVPLYDYWQDQQGTFLVMRWLRGGSLRDALESDPMDMDTVGLILEQICEALITAHKQGVVHRDLKPENILLDEESNAYLTDFGIAKDLGGDRLTQTGSIVGSMNYLAPEQAKGESITPKTDIYGLGVLLYEMLTGEHPFPELTPVQMLQKHLNEPVPTIRTTNTELPEGLDNVIQTATSKNPDERFSTVLDFLSEYRRVWISKEAPTPLVVEVQPPAFLKDEIEIQEDEKPIFVARKKELARLDVFLEKTLAGHGQVVFVTGGPGRGKTALLREFSHQSMQKYPDLLVASGNCNTIFGEGDPYLPFREIMGMLTGGVEAQWKAGDIESDHAHRLWKAIPTSVDILLEHGPYLLDIFVPERDLLSRLKAVVPQGTALLAILRNQVAQKRTTESGLEQTHVFQQVTNVLRILSERHPLMLVLDDMQWADTASIGLLFHLGRRLKGTRIMITCAYRPEEVSLGREGERHPLEKILAELKRYFGDVWVDLAQLDDLEDRHFLEGFLDTEPNRLGKDFQDDLFVHTCGHPLFTIELLRAMQERGDLVQDEDGFWIEGTSLDWETLPARVEGVIEERIGRLEDELRDILTIASVEGEDFTAQVVAKVQEVSERQLLRSLSDELEKRHKLVQEKRRLSVGQMQLSRYRFAHSMFQQYLYNSLGDGERTLLHRTIGQVLEDLYEGQLATVAVQLVNHFAGDCEKEQIYARLAAEQAATNYANTEALRYLNRALVLTAESDFAKRYEIVSACEEIHHLQGQRDAQKEDLIILQELADLLYDDEKRSEAFLRQSKLDKETGDYESAIHSAKRAITLAQASGMTYREAEGYLEWGRALIRLGNLKDAEIQMNQARDLAQTASTPNLEADSLRGLGIIALREGKMIEARELFEESLRLSRMIGDRHSEQKTLNNLGIVASHQGDYVTARDHLEKVLNWFRKIGNRPGESIALLNLGYFAYNQSDFPNARVIFEQALVTFNEVGNRSGMSKVYLNLGAMAAIEGDYGSAKDSYEESLRILREMGEQTGECLALVNLAELACEYGDYPGAASLYIETLHLCRERGEKREESFALAGMGLLNHYLGNNTAAREHCNQALLLIRELGLRDMEGTVLTILGYILQGLGRSDQAAEAFQQGLSIHRDQGKNDHAIENLAGLASIALDNGELNEALTYVDEILAFTEDNTLRCVSDIRVFLTCFQVLQTSDDPRSKDILNKAHTLLQDCAAKIPDAQLRRSFMEEVPHNREILATYEARG